MIFGSKARTPPSDRVNLGEINLGILQELRLEHSGGEKGMPVYYVNDLQESSEPEEQEKAEKRTLERRKISKIRLIPSGW